MNASSPTRRAILSCSVLIALTPLHSNAAQVFVQDVVVQGSLGVGVDTVSSESFGFDTLRLKENNLRLHFDDTSNSASFPGNDWRIVINDSSNGGANYFAIEDSTAGAVPFRIEAGAPADSLIVDSNDRIGFGTATPSVSLHNKFGDTPTLRLEQDGSRGWTAQTWDIGSNETNFFVRDITNGSKLPFRIKPGADENSIFVNADGYIGLGNDAPKAPLHATVGTDATSGVLVGPSNFTDLKGVLHVEGTAFISKTLEIGSSRTRKEKIRDLTLNEARTALRDLQPVQFHYKDDPESQLGFIAEDVPDAVATAKRQSVRPMDFVAVLAKVVQEHERREAELSKTIDNQQALLEKLSKRLDALEKQEVEQTGDK